MFKRRKGLKTIKEFKEAGYERNYSRCGFTSSYHIYFQDENMFNSPNGITDDMLHRGIIFYSDGEIRRPRLR